MPFRKAEILFRLIPAEAEHGNIVKLVGFTGETVHVGFDLKASVEAVGLDFSDHIQNSAVPGFHNGDNLVLPLQGVRGAHQVVSLFLEALNADCGNASDIQTFLDIRPQGVYGNAVICDQNIHTVARIFWRNTTEGFPECGSKLLRTRAEICTAKW